MTWRIMQYCYIPLIMHALSFEFHSRLQWCRNMKILDDRLIVLKTLVVIPLARAYNFVYFTMPKRDESYLQISIPRIMRFIR